ncbi:uncharacterized protein Pyn_04723 [Prunus yedoensis var. nudiflora]|uniref:Uncharacterized protein n=1 Tax=Prunus yedoensis var. nudiflora TaxID=2094558 RepID=A0A314UYH8_PRUYE|nr:uncharacterized protein Pyn_04723 [Prunus yedoensis var. nudiflora]
MINLTCPIHLSTLSLPEDWEQTSMSVNQEEVRSVCLFVSSCENRECTNTVYEVKFKHRGEVTHEPPVVRQVAKFREGFCLNAARIFNHSKLYCIGQDGGFIVDTRSWSKCSSIPPIPSSNLLETIVCAYGKLRDTPSGDIIPIIRRDWNRVKIDTSAHGAPLLEGRAMVVNETIYALYGDAKIKAFSFIGEPCDVNGISYSLRQLFIVQGLDIARPLLPWLNEMTHYLVHLRNHDFFYVQTGWCDSHPKIQYLSITTFEIVLGKGGKHLIKTIDSFVHSVDIKGSEWFNLVFLLHTVNFLHISCVFINNI